MTTEQDLDTVAVARVLGRLDRVVARTRPVDHIDAKILEELSADAHALLALSAGPSTVGFLIAATRLPTARALAAYRQLDDRGLLRHVAKRRARTALSLIAAPQPERSAEGRGLIARIRARLRGDSP